MRNFIDKNGNIIMFVLTLFTLPPIWDIVLSTIKLPTLLCNDWHIFFDIFVILLLLSIIIYIKMKNKKNKLDTDSPYLLSISHLIEDELSRNGFNISSININEDGITLNDIISVCEKVLYSNISKNKIINAVKAARAYAYTIKYAEPRNEDEKRVDIHGLQDWKVYFNKMLVSIGMSDLSGKIVLNVGIGNAVESKGLFSECDLYGVDISQKALDYAAKIFPNLHQIIDEAENLSKISNNFCDVYISLRTYCSSFFDIRKSIIEAYRVLKNGGIFIISIPILFIKKNGKKINGLINYSKGSVETSIANSKLIEVKKYLSILRFNKIKIHRESPYEIYITAQKN